MEETDAQIESEEQRRLPPRAWSRKRWIRQSLATAAIVACCLGWWAYAARRQGEAVRAIRALGGAVVYLDDMPFRDPYSPILWLERKLGHDYTSPVGQVQLVGKRVRTQDLSCLKSCRGLRALWLNDANIDDSGLAVIARLRRLEELSLCGTRITDAGLSSLRGLQRLEFLYLNDTDVSDAGLVHLEQLGSLKHLELKGARVTAFGARRLSQALPDTWITYSSPPPRLPRVRER